MAVTAVLRTTRPNAAARSAEASSSATNVHAVLANERQGLIQTGACHKFFCRAGSSIFESWGRASLPQITSGQCSEKAEKRACDIGQIQKRKLLWWRSAARLEAMASGAKAAWQDGNPPAGRPLPIVVRGTRSSHRHAGSGRKPMISPACLHRACSLSTSTNGASSA
jgi:hypothetical protein